MTALGKTVRETVQHGANERWELGLSEEQLTQFGHYAEMLVEWNATRLNLTRLTTPRDIAVKHFLDSLALLTVLDLPKGIRVIDVGTGAGLPGLALKIARPDLQITLLDATAKKLAFCRAVADDLELSAVTIIHARAEDTGQRSALVGQFDLVTARAVAPLEKLLGWLAPFAGQTGQIAAFKGSTVEAELTAAKPIARKIGLILPSAALSVVLPEAEEPLIRQIVLVQKSQPCTRK